MDGLKTFIIFLLVILAIVALSTNYCLKNVPKVEKLATQPVEVSGVRIY